MDARRLDSLTSLRAVAAFAVFALHIHAFPAIDQTTSSGFVGVSFFFLLSGFVLAWSRRAHDAPKEFWVRRFARVHPSHVATFILWAVIVAFGFYEASPPGAAVANLFLLQAFVPINDWVQSMNGVTWSLSCELLFYAAFPFAIVVMARLDRRRLAIVTAGLVAIALLIPTIAYLVWGRDTWPSQYLTYFAPETRLFEFLIGIGIALLIAGSERTESSRRIPLAAAAALAFGAYLVVPLVPSAFRYEAVTLVPFMILIVAAVQRDRVGQRSVLNNRFFIHLGEISFAFYLVHVMVISLVHRVLGDAPDTFTGSVVLFAVALVASVIAAEALHRGVEIPINSRVLNLRRARTTTAARPAEA